MAVEPITIIGALVAVGWGIGKIRKWRREQASGSGWTAGEEGRVFSGSSSTSLSGGSGTDGAASSGDHGGHGHGGDCSGHGHGGGDCSGHGGGGGGHGW